MKIKTTYLLTALFVGVFMMASCNSETKKHAKSSTNLDITGNKEKSLKNNKEDEIDKKYIEYLDEYGSSSNPEINFVTVGNITYWVTHYYGSGTRQEYFWVLSKNKLIPKFIFEYGGMPGVEELEYTFINIKTNVTVDGKAFENNMEKEKEKFILKKL
ncbi:hypothetical protein DR871_013865 [Flavobacterium petrolei]|uniref:Lipoprotein n=1 Tax=Flavobacterium petrolei TaxID=2259594 RepID=A0A482THS2_9FLAO|nr:hypothetical protein [Flavobacterium petrolei]RYJ51008.1 hypothetical protein DR871_013865 [Flavobacterium petrolei]